MDAYLLDWINLLLRWAHLIVGIAWIGASFYFVMLDNSLTSPKKLKMRNVVFMVSSGRCTVEVSIAARSF